MNMDKLITCLDRLIKKDQDSIKSFRKGEITRDEFSFVSSNISKEFLDCIKTYNFPYHDIASEDIYKAAITLALHLGLDDLKYIYNRYIEGQSASKITPEHKAMFVDKIRVASGQLQLYGTQYKVDKDMNAELLPLENEKDVNEIRKEAGLQSLEKYMESVKQAFEAKN